MQSKDNDLRRRFEELADRAKRGFSPLTSDFLSLAEQQILYSAVSQDSFHLLGGYDAAERKLAVFGANSAEEALQIHPYRILHIAPKSQKFAESLSHRDFLGSLLAVGIRREMLGDLVLSENTAYVFAKPSVVDFIQENLTKVRHTAVLVTQTDTLPSCGLPQPEESLLLASSTRLDALLAAVFRLSRKDAQSLLASGKVFLNGREVRKADLSVPPDTVVSARGFGRFKLLSQVGTSKKGRLRLSLLLYR